jgi:hypothetical protein
VREPVEAVKTPDAAGKNEQGGQLELKRDTKGKVPPAPVWDGRESFLKQALAW